MHKAAAPWTCVGCTGLLLLEWGWIAVELPLFEWVRAAHSAAAPWMWADYLYGCFSLDKGRAQSVHRCCSSDRGGFHRAATHSWAGCSCSCCSLDWEVCHSHNCCSLDRVRPSEAAALWTVAGCMWGCCFHERSKLLIFCYLRGRSMG